MQIIKSLKDSGLLINDVTQTIENDQKKKKRREMPGMFLCTLVQFHREICY